MTRLMTARLHAAHWWMVTLCEKLRCVLQTHRSDGLVNIYALLVLRFQSLFMFSRRPFYKCILRQLLVKWLINLNWDCNNNNFNSRKVEALQLQRWRTLRRIDHTKYSTVKSEIPGQLKKLITDSTHIDLGSVSPVTDGISLGCMPPRRYVHSLSTLLHRIVVTITTQVVVITIVIVATRAANESSQQQDVL